MELTVRFPGVRGAKMSGEENAVKDMLLMLTEDMPLEKMCRLMEGALMEAQEQTKEAPPVELPEEPKEVCIDHGEDRQFATVGSCIDTIERVLEQKPVARESKFYNRMQKLKWRIEKWDQPADDRITKSPT